MEEFLHGSLSLGGIVSRISGDDPVAASQYPANASSLLFHSVPVFALLIIIPLEYLVHNRQQLPQGLAPQPLAPSKLLRGLLLIVVESGISYYEIQRIAATDAVLYIITCMPSVAAIANVHDYYHQHGPTFSVRLYLVAVCLSDISRATHYSAQNCLLAAALSGLAVLLNWPQVKWLWEYLSPSRNRIGHYIWTRYHNLLVRTSITRRLYDFLSTGSRRYQSVDELPPFPEQSGPGRLCDKFELVWSAANKRSQLVLFKVILRVLFWPHFSILLPVLCCQACQLFLAILMRRTIRLISESPSPDLFTRTSLVVQTGAVSIMLMVFAVWRAKMRGTFNILLRSLLSSAVLKKSLRLYLSDAYQDRVSTNLNSDLEQLMSSMEAYHRLAFAPVEICMGLFTFYYYDGVIALFMLPPLFVALGISFFIGHVRMNAISAWSDRAEERTAKSFQILASIKDIKVLGLESVIIRYLQQFRNLEVTAAQRVHFLTMITVATVVLVTDVSPLTIMAGGVFWTKSIVDIKAVAVFSTMAFVTAIVEPSISLVQDAPRMLRNIKPIRNLQAFLLLPDKPDMKPIEGTPTQDEATRMLPRMHGEAVPLRQQEYVSPRVVVEFRKVSITTQPGHLPLFSNITLSITAGSTVMVTGPIGSGKTSFLRAIVGEARVLGGSLLMHIDTQSIAYCGQIAWLRNTTIRANIIDKCEFDEEWYNAVLLVTFLTEDIERLQDGDLYQVGTGGSKLSGGQRQRIAIARALYCKAQLIIFDDVLSVLDAETASSIFTELIGSNGLLVKLGITVVMSTFSANFLGVADQVIFINDNHQLKVATGEAEVERAIIDYINPETPVPIDFEVIQKKKALAAYNNLMDRDNRTQLAIEQENWGEFDTGGYVLLLQLIPKPVLFKWLILIAFYSLSGRAPDTFTRIWADLAPNNLALFWVYGLIILMRVMVVLYEGGIYNMSAIPQAAMKLHEDLLKALMRKPLLILAAMDDGFLFNRIIGDVNIVSDDWPLMLKSILNAGTLLIWDLCLITYGVPIFFVMIPPLIMSIFWIQKLSLGLAQQLRTFRSANNAALFSQITEVRSGLEHIRTMGYRDGFFRMYLHILEEEQRIGATSLKSQLWRLMCQYLLTTVILITITLSGTSGKAGITAGGVGLAWLLGQWTWLVVHNTLDPLIYLEESSASAARLKAFMALEPEPDHDEIPQDWPARGSIKFDNVNATYTTRAESYTALHEVSFEIEGGTKVGVIGPTGSGKSTLILTILNHMDYDGSVTIDGVELSTIPRERRENLITVITQQPAKLPGTLRNNLLPWEISIDEHAASTHADEDLYALLEQLGLRTHVEFNGGLDTLADDMNFSFGQRQLVSIAMAILHNRSFQTKIVLLDEVTSSLDSEMDDKVHGIMQTAFEGSTIFVVAHRTDLLYYVDTVAELERGWLALSEPPM